MPGIIKAGRAAEESEGIPLRAFPFEDVGQVYLDRVRGEAARLIADAKRDAAKIKAQALSEGQQAAIDSVQATLGARLEGQLLQALAAVRQAAARIDDSRQAWQRHGEEQLVRLAAAIATRLCRRELARSPALTLTWVREALALASGNVALKLHLHPQDHALLAGQINTLIQSMSSLGEVQIVADPAISSGGCRVETQFGTVDQQLEAQLARLTEELLD